MEANNLIFAHSPMPRHTRDRVIWIDFFRRSNGIEHFLARFDVEPVGNLFLKRCQKQVHEQNQGLFFPDNLDNIHIPPPVCISEAQFHTYSIRIFCQNGFFNKLCTAPGHMGRADENDGFVSVTETVDHVVVVFFHCLFHLCQAFLPVYMLMSAQQGHPAGSSLRYCAY